MPVVIYDGQSYDCAEQSVLDCLTAHGVSVPFSCRSGICQSCMMRVEKGEVPDSAKSGLKPTLAAQNYFLACSCYPETDVEVSLADTSVGTVEAKVTRVERLNDDILGIWLHPSNTYPYKAGQFIRIYRDKTNFRCYSLASVPALDEDLFLNVRRVGGGMMSNWIFENLTPGTEVTISEACGDCFYVPGKPEQDIILIGTGSGLAPLYGIVRDALLNGHSGKLSLYHGNTLKAGFYLVETLRKLARKHPNLSYIPCVSADKDLEGYAAGMVLDIAMTDNPDLTGWRVFLCGNPDMVNAAKKLTFFSGASMNDIFADPF